MTDDIENRDIVGAAANAAPDPIAAPDDSLDLASIHQPVLLDDCVDLVTSNLEASAATHGGMPVLVDCTLGLAGHSSAFLAANPDARLIGIDRDAEALALATRRLEQAGFADRFTPVHAAFDELGAVLERLGIHQVDAVFMDLGLSSLQIDETDRGFSYSHDAPLDMRMDPSQPTTAADILATYDAADLRRIFKEYGEERFAGPIAQRIVRERQETPIVTSAQLNDLVDRTVPRAHRASGNPAKRVFQALRIEVNGELDKLASTLPQAALRLAVGGRLVVESYHSLEDRTVKRFMAKGLTIDAPAGLPVVPDDAQPFFHDATHGAIKADDAEIASNPRSASVRLRAVELIRPIPASRRRELADDAAGPGADGTRTPGTARRRAGRPGGGHGRSAGHRTQHYERTTGR